MKKKSIIILGLLILVVFPYMSIEVTSQTSDPVVLRFGTYAGPHSDRGLDPHYILDYTSIAVIDQVVERLFAHDLSDPELKIIPRLAADFGNWSDDYLTYTVPLRKDVTFHDGTTFDASAVKWNFDRLKYFLNIDGSASVDTPMFSYLYLWPDGTPIIDSVEYNSDDVYTVEFMLTKPYVPFEALLCFSGSGIIRPDEALETEYIDTFEEGVLVGTGPFVYDEYIENEEVIFHANENYWAGEPNIDELIFSIIPNAADRTWALIDGEIDFINAPAYSMIGDLGSHLIDAGQSATIYFLTMNNKLIPIQMRKAISYALDYDSILEIHMNGETVRLRSPIPLGIPYANWDFKVPETDLIKARQILIDSDLYGVLPAVNDDDAWEELADEYPIATYQYTYILGTLRLEFLESLQNELKKIGVIVEGVGRSLEDIRKIIHEIDGHSRDELELYLYGWAADIVDPSNFINELCTNEEIASNVAQVDDKKLQNLMNEALVDHDPKKREGLYNKIQKRLIQQIYPWCWGWVPKNYDARNVNFGGFQSNPLDIVWFYPVYLVPNNG